ncbi:hypothetical protein GA0070622_2792 [Micromonospora sediminicola]|uniref:Uncharacterized protein n=1 Tax=Micromonospora sediminicola TaxID=946078 RepID=A0A1A9BA57_9ACTN|nr:hypothetical protein [Micromonospora sediminicola]SBT65782.1 hypothetical protein GA0070622_2792 [Micromonospora sediminicola]
MRGTRVALVTVGTLISAYALLRVVTDRDADPLGQLLFLAGLVAAHDAVVLPVAIVLGALVARFSPDRIRGPIRFAGFVTAAVLVVAMPLVLGYGRRPDTPSALPLGYGRGLGIALLVVWSATLAASALRQVSRRRRRTRGQEE